MKRKRKNNEYYFDDLLACGDQLRDAFEEMNEVHDYFIYLDAGAALQVTAKSLSTGCRMTVGIYQPDMSPVDVQPVIGTGSATMQQALHSGEYVIRLRCETSIAGAYQFNISCDLLHWKVGLRRVQRWIKQLISPSKRKN